MLFRSVGMRVRGVSRGMEEMRREWYEDEVSRIDSMVMAIEMERAKDEAELVRLRGGLDSMRASWAKSRGEVKSIEDWFKNKKGGLQ